MKTAIGIEERPFRIEVTRTPPAIPDSGFDQAVYLEAVKERDRRPDFRPFHRAHIELIFVFKHRRERDPSDCRASMQTAIDYLVRAGVLEKNDDDHVEYGRVEIESDWHTGPLTIIEITEAGT